MDSEAGGKPVCSRPSLAVLNLPGPNGGVEPAWAEARPAESCKIAPKEDIDGQQQHRVNVADAPPERLLRDAGQFLCNRQLVE